jgi:hypothetical protein
MHALPCPHHVSHTARPAPPLVHGLFPQIACARCMPTCAFVTPCVQRGKGDLYVTYSIAMPQSVSDAQKAQLAVLFKDSQWHQHDEL